MNGMTKAHIEQLAATAHEINRKYCQTLGDHSQPRWGDAPEWQKQSARDGVEYVVEYPDATPEEQHENWMAVKEADGWTWGPEKIPGLKLHPCMVAYEHLPDEQKFKDKLFRTIVLTGVYGWDTDRLEGQE